MTTRTPATDNDNGNGNGASSPLGAEALFDGWVTVTEAAEVLDVSVATASNWARRGYLGEVERVPSTHARLVRRTNVENLADRLRDAVSLTEACRIAGMRRDTLIDAINAGQIPGAIQMGGVTRVPVPALKRWLQKG